MITVTKDDPYIQLGKTNCPPMSTAGIWGHRTGAHVKIEDDPDNPGMVRIGPVPDRLPNGVYSLVIRLKGDREKCFTMKVNVLMCEPPRFPVKHFPTFPDMGGTITECCPDAMIDSKEPDNG